MEREKWKEELDRFALRVHKMGLGSVVLFLLESVRPLSGVIFNFGLFGRPIVDVIVPREFYDRLLSVLEDPQKIEYLITRLEEVEDGMAVGPSS